MKIGITVIRVEATSQNSTPAKPARSARPTTIRTRRVRIKWVVAPAVRIKQSCPAQLENNAKTRMTRKGMCKKQIARRGMVIISTTGAVPATAAGTTTTTAVRWIHAATATTVHAAAKHDTATTNDATVANDAAATMDGTATWVWEHVTGRGRE